MMNHKQEHVAKPLPRTPRVQRVRGRRRDSVGGLAAHVPTAAAFPVRLRTNVWGPLAPSTMAWGPAETRTADGLE